MASTDGVGQATANEERACPQGCGRRSKVRYWTAAGWCCPACFMARGGEAASVENHGEVC